MLVRDRICISVLIVLIVFVFVVTAYFLKRECCKDVQ